MIVVVSKLLNKKCYSDTN